MSSMRYGFVLSLFCSPALGQSPEKVEVTGKKYSWLDTVQTASEGKVDQEQLEQRPILRPGEIMEAVPGLVTTQHSGTGKANQFFLRGFNLDHGTDFATFVDGIPINMPSHGHGQGYTDINFLVPELLENLEYSKGPYSARVGDFSGAGHVHLKTLDVVPSGLVKYTGGSFGYNRLLLLDSLPVGESGQLSYALEGTKYEGPWSDIDEKLRKKLAWFKYFESIQDGQYSLIFQHYDASWNSADQIPERAVANGLMDRLGSLNKSTGGRTARDSLTGILHKKWGEGALRLQLFGVNYGLNIWSDPTYYLDDSINGDQFEQEDRRSIIGGHASYSLPWAPGALTIGLQSRYDDIGNIGLYKTTERQREAVRNEFSVKEHQLGLFLEQEFLATSRLRATLGLRFDQITFETRNKLSGEQSEEQAAMTSPKLTTSYSVADGWQIFASGGQSFHSNDARGVTSQNEAAPGIVPVRGYEAGTVFNAEDWLRISLALWRLELNSELIYIGDAGVTEASKASQRNGVDWLLQYSPSPGFHADLELSWARARFKSDPENEGREVEGHLPFVAMLGLGSQINREWSASAQFRHFGKRPLVADGSQKSGRTSVLNLQAAYEIDQWELVADILNALNSKDHDIDYYYESRLQTENEPVADIHYHPVEPGSLRVSVARKF
jgi:outer membrane receptor protein involved in Fe transport